MKRMQDEREIKNQKRGLFFGALILAVLLVLLPVVSLLAAYIILT